MQPQGSLRVPGKGTQGARIRLYHSVPRSPCSACFPCYCFHFQKISETHVHVPPPRPSLPSPARLQQHPAWGTISNLSLPLYILQVGVFPCKLHMPHPCLKHFRGFQLHSEDQPLLPSTGQARTWLSLHAPLPAPCLSSPLQTSCLLSPKCSTSPPASGTQLPVLTRPE